MSKIQVLIVTKDQYRYGNENEFIKEALEYLNYETHRAYTLPKAQELIAAGKIDFIISNLSLHIETEQKHIALIKTLAEHSPIIPFVFIVGNSDRSVFAQINITQPHTFLLKPFNELELNYTIELVLEKYNTERNNASQLELSFFFKKRDHFHKVTPSNIIYIEADGRYCNAHTETNSFIIKDSLTEFHKRLPADQFAKIHRKFIVNYNSIKEVHPDDNLVILQNDKTIALGRAQKAEFFRNYEARK